MSEDWKTMIKIPKTKGNLPKDLKPGKLYKLEDIPEEEKWEEIPYNPLYDPDVKHKERIA